MSDLVIGLIVGGVVFGGVGVIVGGLLGSADHRDEYAEALDEVGRALREAYAFIHVMGEWSTFEETGFIVPTSPPGEEASFYADHRRAQDERVSRATARFSGVRPHERLGIDPPRRSHHPPSKTRFWGTSL